jgi:hypothetical protein
MIITGGGDKHLTIKRKRIRSLPKKGFWFPTYDIHRVLEAAFSATLGSWIIKNLTIEVQDQEDLESINTEISKGMNIAAYNWNNLHEYGQYKPQ